MDLHIDNITLEELEEIIELSSVSIFTILDGNVNLEKLNKALKAKDQFEILIKQNPEKLKQLIKELENKKGILIKSKG